VYAFKLAIKIFEGKLTTPMLSLLVVWHKIQQELKHSHRCYMYRIWLLTC